MIEFQQAVFDTRVFQDLKSRAESCLQEIVAAASGDNCRQSPQTYASLPNTRILVIDIGGHHTKVSLRSSDANSQLTWQTISDTKNTEVELDPSADLPLKSFFREILEQLPNDCKKKIDGVGIAWSNELVHHQLEDNRGIGAKVAGMKGRDKGGTHLKDEPFLKGLKNRTDLSAIFLEELTRTGINPAIFLVDNDTPLVFKCLSIEQDVDSAIAASSGINTVIIIAGLLYNTEMGCKLSIPMELVYPNIGKQLTKELYVEELAGGSFMPEIFGLKAARIVPELAEKQFTGEDLNLLIDNQEEKFLLKHLGSTSLEGSPRQRLVEIAREVVTKGGALAAFVAYASVLQKIESGQKSLKIAADSSQCRYMPLYQKTLQDTLAQLARVADVSIEFVLAQPLAHPDGTEVTPTNQGAAVAVNDLLVQLEQS